MPSEMVNEIEIGIGIGISNGNESSQPMDQPSNAFNAILSNPIQSQPIISHNITDQIGYPIL